MKNQALVAAISGLLIGGVGFTNKINFLQVTGFGLLISSVTVTLIKDQKQPKSDPQPPTLTSVQPKKLLPKPNPKSQKNKAISQPILKVKQVAQTR